MTYQCSICKRYASADGIRVNGKTGESGAYVCLCCAFYGCPHPDQGGAAVEAAAKGAE